MKVHSKLARVRSWLKWFATKHPQTCVFCGRLMHPDDFLVGDSSDGMTIHHADEDRSNNAIGNLHLYCRGCHQKQHRKTEVA